MANETENKYLPSLEKVEELIASYVADGATRIVNINGVQFSYASLDDLLKLRALYRELAHIWDITHGMATPRYRIEKKLYLK